MFILNKMFPGTNNSQSWKKKHSWGPCTKKCTVTSFSIWHVLVLFSFHLTAWAQSPTTPAAIQTTQGSPLGPTPVFPEAGQGRGLALLTPQLIAAQSRDLWVGAALEEHFYRAGQFSKRHFVPPAHQLHALLQNCFLNEADACLRQVGKSLGVGLIADIAYERRGPDFIGYIRWVKTESQEERTDTLVRKALDPFDFIQSVIHKVFNATGPLEPEVLEVLKTRPSTHTEAYGAFVMGVRYFNQRDFRRVFYPLKRARELDPSFTEPLAVEAQAYFQLGKDQEALSLLEQLPEAASTWSTDLIRIRVLLRQGKSESALRTLRRLKTQVPGNLAELEYVQGLYYQSVGSYSRAVSYLIAAINFNPSVLEYYMTLGEEYISHDEPDLALPYYQKLVKYSLGEPKYRLQYAIALRMSREYARSIDILKELLDQYPDFFPARINLGIAYYELGWVKKARKAFETNIELRQDTLSSLLNLAILEIQEGRIKESKVVFQRILTLYPHSSKTLVNLGLLEADYGSTGQAEQYLKKALEYNQTDTVALLGLARVYQYTGQDPEEYAILNRVREVDPENISTLSRLAEKSLNRKAFEEAIDYLQDVIDLKPMAYRQRIALARALIRVRDSERAQSHLQYIEVNFSNSPEVQMELGSSYYEEGMFDRAILAVEPLLKVDPREKRYHIHLAKCYIEQIVQGQSRRVDAPKKALEHLLLAIQLAPEYWENYYWMGRYQRKVMGNKKSAEKFLEKAMDFVKKTKDKDVIKEELLQLKLL